MICLIRPAWNFVWVYIYLPICLVIKGHKAKKKKGWSDLYIALEGN